MLMVAEHMALVLKQQPNFSEAEIATDAQKKCELID
jgi:hypothetical protein